MFPAAVFKTYNLSKALLIFSPKRISENTFFNVETFYKFL